MRMFRRQNEEPPIDDNIIEGEIEALDDSPLGETAPTQTAPPRRQRFWKRQKSTPPPAGETPLERVAPDIPTPEEIAITPYVRHSDETSGQGSRFRFRLPTIHLPNVLAWREIRPNLLLLAGLLIFTGVFWTLHNRGQTSQGIEDLLPLLVLGGSLVWSLSALLTRRPTTFLAATVLVGISISFWLDAQDLITLQETLVGTILITVGVGIMARGLVLRQRVSP